MENRSIFWPSILNGFFAGIFLLAFSLVLFLIGINEKSPVYFFYYLIFAAGLAWAMIQVRNNSLNGYASFGKMFLIGLYATLAIAIIMSIYNYVHIKFLDPGMIERTLQNAEEAIIERQPDITDEQLEQALALTKIFMKPFVASVVSFVGTTIIGLLLSLVIAAFTKKESTTIEV